MQSNIYAINNGKTILLVDLNSLCSCEIDRDDFTREHVERCIAEHLNDPRPYYLRLKPRERPKEGIVPVIVTSFHCNYACEYCYQKPSKLMREQMSPEHIDAIMRYYQWLEEYYHIPCSFERISVIGGEPLLPENRDVLERIGQIWPDQRITITTNGTYLLEYEEFLSSHRTELIVSLDGTEERHYSRRKTKDPDAYRKTIEGLRRMLKKNILVDISTVFSPERPEEYIRFFDEMEQLGWRKNPNLRISFVPEIESSNDDYRHEAIIKNLKAFSELRKTDPRAWSVNGSKLLPGGVALLDALKMAKSGEYDPYRCGCLNNPSYAFLPDGSISPCLSIQNDQFSIGRYLPKPELNEALLNALAKRRIDRTEKCEACSYRVFCMGGCLWTALEKTGKVNGLYCDLWDNMDYLQYFEDVMGLEAVADSVSEVTDPIGTANQ